jgi:hypothetical protein
MKKFFLALGIIFFFLAKPAFAQVYDPEYLKTIDSDQDGLSDYDEQYIFHTDNLHADTDGDGYFDGDEVKNGYDPSKAGDDKLQKEIKVDLATQSLAYSLGQYQLGSFLISSGTKGFNTPAGDYKILVKKPLVDYKGKNYDYPDTKWNLLFKYQKGGNLYIHGAYWHNNFGQPMSHGCVNVSYSNMEGLYNWASVGTQVIIR